MKKILSFICVLALCGAVFAGCSAADAGSSAVQSSSPAGDSPSAADGSSAVTLSGIVATGGSTSMEKVIGALGEAFATQNPDVQVTYDPTGSGAGITAAQNGTADIGLSSRALKEEEAAGLTGTVVALDGIAIIVHPDNPVSDLSMEQLKQIADGSVTNWKDVGGGDAEIVLIGREAGSGTRDGFESILDVKDACQYAQTQNATGGVIATVASNTGAIGYASLSAVGDSVKTLSVDGVTPTEATVKDGSYQVQRPFLFVTNSTAALSPQAQAFLAFAQSPEAAEIISAAGAVYPG
ncbi:MAG: phosphate ABC transporter substrate-binding protein [Oscillospiraceae bacterium]|nr:phosphate ABC transporter substrate-binding protein [Oscillospiraceae bacterium]